MELIELQPLNETRRFKSKKSKRDIAEFILSDGQMKIWSNNNLSFIPFSGKYKIVKK